MNVDHVFDHEMMFLYLRFHRFAISLSLKPLPLILPSTQPWSPGETPVHRSFMSYSGRVLPMVWWGPMHRRVLSRKKMQLPSLSFYIFMKSIRCVEHENSLPLHTPCLLTCACFFNPLCFPIQKWIGCPSRTKTSTTEIFTNESKSGR